ncbi:MAG TPA: DCC1-like thiol-disulfide oxidoreductase family protein [Fimbriimonadaceae bacterium]|nr:DCC1-like thiol-disulfide oxidoreductase family protein [Fimbriimonadaceae bacterium]
MSDGESHPVILFDGVCNLCSATVQWVVRRDPRDRFRFASLQSDVAQRLLGSLEMGQSLNSIVLVDERGVHTRSTAALRIAMKLRFPWPILAAFLIVPRPIRDGVYRWIARNRYRWFGKKEACWIPTPALRARFLDGAESPATTP